MALRLSHLNLPASDPENLAAWYAKHLGFERRGAFLLAPGTLIAFEAGVPLGARGNTHFGFQVDDIDTVYRWAEHFGTNIESEPGYAATRVHDPEGNCFEIYWEPNGPNA
ncbi:MAG TPA: VOC family protein [Steroidobacteraceae bacterium]|nr:VOC family protein [Steroidobacteraceae bacterium]